MRDTSPATPMTNDLEHLKLLSIFHYVVGGLAALCSLFPLLHLGMGIAMVTGRMPDAADQPEAVLFGWFFIIFAAGMIVGGVSFALGLVLAGRFLARRVNYIFCFVMAALSCIFVPFGTVLGVFTMVVLMRPTVKEMFAAR
jgi:hypothetical protein